jgi:voltage-gated potassium channel
LKDVQKNTLLLATSFAILNILLSSVLILIFEQGNEANIKTARDAIWWSFVTMTTVGYGDHYPVTIGGRIVAIILMVTGITLFGVVTASLGNLLLKMIKRSKRMPLK